MTGRATIRKQLGARFALIEILSLRRTGDQHRNHASREQTAPQSLARHKCRCYMHAAVVLRRNRVALVMSSKCRDSLPVPPGRVMVEERQKGGDARGG